MGIIQCSENCKFQLEGYCNLDKLSTVTSVKNNCPYFVPILNNKTDSLSQTFNPDNF